MPGNAMRPELDVRTEKAVSLLANYSKDPSNENRALFLDFINMKSNTSQFYIRFIEAAGNDATISPELRKFSKKNGELCSENIGKFLDQLKAGAAKRSLPRRIIDMTDTDQLSSLLLDKTATLPERQKAAELLGGSGQKAVAPLIKALVDEDVRVSASRALMGLWKHSVPALIASLGSKDAQERRWSAYALGIIGSPQAVAPLSGLLNKDGDDAVRVMASLSLAAIGTKESYSALINGLSSGDERMREICAEAISQAGVHAVPQLIAALKDADAWKQASILLQKMARRSLIYLIDGLKTDDPVIWKELVNVIGRIGKPAVPALIQAIKSDDVRIRRGAASALSWIGTLDAGTALSEATNDADARVRAYAIEGLKGIIGFSDVPAHIEALKSDDVNERRNAARELNDVKDFRALPALATAAKDKDIQVRQLAVEALGYYGYPAAIPEIARALDDSDEYVAKAAVFALARIGGRRSEELLVKVLEGDKAPGVQMDAVVSLGKMGSKRSTKALVKVLESDKEKRIRVEAANSLARIGDPDSMEALIRVSAKATGALKTAVDLAIFTINRNPRREPGSL